MVRGPVGTVCILLLSNHAGVSDCFMIHQNIAVLGNRSSDETPAYNDQGCTLSCIEWWSPKSNSSFHKNRCIYRYKIWISESTRIAIVGILAGLIHWYTWGTSMNLQLSARKTTTMTTATTTTTSMEHVGVKRSSRARKENDLNMTLMCRNLSEENIIRTRNLKLSFGKVNQLMGHLRIGHEAGRLLMIAQEYGSNEAPTSDIPTYSTLNWYIMYANVVSLVSHIIMYHQMPVSTPVWCEVICISEERNRAVAFHLSVPVWRPDIGNHGTEGTGQTQKWRKSEGVQWCPPTNDVMLHLTCLAFQLEEQEEKYHCSTRKG